MQRKKIQEAMKNVYFQKMTANGYHEIEEQIAKLQQQRPAKIEQLKAARALTYPKIRNIVLLSVNYATLRAGFGTSINSFNMLKL